MVIAASSMDAVSRFKTEISQFFDITDGGEISWFLNFEIRLVWINWRSSEECSDWVT